MSEAALVGKQTHVWLTVTVNRRRRRDSGCLPVSSRLIDQQIYFNSSISVLNWLLPDFILPTDPMLHWLASGVMLLRYMLTWCLWLTCTANLAHMANHLETPWEPLNTSLATTGDSPHWPGTRWHVSQSQTLLHVFSSEKLFTCPQLRKASNGH